MYGIYIYIINYVVYSRKLHLGSKCQYWELNPWSMSCKQKSKNRYAVPETCCSWRLYSQKSHRWWGHVPWNVTGEMESVESDTNNMVICKLIIMKHKNCFVVYWSDVTVPGWKLSSWWSSV